MSCRNEQKHYETNLLPNLRQGTDDTAAGRLPSRTRQSRLQLGVGFGPSSSQASTNNNDHTAKLPSPALPPFPRTPSPKLVASTPAGTFLFSGSAPQQKQQKKRQQLSLKRRRPVTDVDGPNTAALCCKKRRLRRFLITSRLSQPFSQPASHILNRESAALGDKRFLKLAAVANARRIVQLPLPLCTGSSLSPSHLSSPSLTPRTRNAMVPVPHSPCPSEILRRVALGNCYRRRVMGEVPPGRQTTSLPTQQETYTTRMPPLWPSVPLFTNSLSLSPSPSDSVFVVFHNPVGPGSASPLSMITPPQTATVTANAPMAIYSPILSQPSKPVPLIGTHEANACLASDYDAGDLDCAFPASQNESRYDVNDDPDPDDIYSDFSVLFKVPGEESDFEEGFDDYMDELDGIAHLAR